MLKAVMSAVIVSTGVCCAQADRAAVTGTILDPSRSAVPQATVSVIYSSTGLRRETSSSSSGAFHVGGLPIGICYLEVKAPGFSPLKTQAFELSVGETRTLDVTLDLAAAAEAVEVKGVADP